MENVITFILYINTIATDDLETQGARASTAIVSTYAIFQAEQRKVWILRSVTRIWRQTKAFWSYGDHNQV